MNNVRLLIRFHFQRSKCFFRFCIFCLLVGLSRFSSFFRGFLSLDVCCLFSWYVIFFSLSFFFFSLVSFFLSLLCLIVDSWLGFLLFVFFLGFSQFNSQCLLQYANQFFLVFGSFIFCFETKGQFLLCIRQLLGLSTSKICEMCSHLVCLTNNNKKRSYIPQRG